MSERSDEKQPVWFGHGLRGLKAVEIHAIRQHHGVAFRDRGAIALRHDHDVIHFAPRRGLELLPKLELPAQVPILAQHEQLGEEIKGNIVLHQDGARRRAILGILRHLGEFELCHLRPPVAYGLPQCGMESGRIELLHHVGAVASSCKWLPVRRTKTICVQISSNSAGGGSAVSVNATRI